MTLYYKNSNGQILNLDAYPFRLLSKNTLFDYSWDYVTKGINNLSIAKFSKKMKKKSMSIVVSGDDVSDFYNNLNTFVETTDIDVVNLSKGKIYFNDYYISCYVVASSKPSKFLNLTQTTLDIDLVVERDGWIKETTTFFGKITNEVYQTDGLGFPHDYPHDFGSSLTNQLLVNDSYASSEFELRIYGSCTNPSISINSQVYGATTTLETGEVLIINSMERTIKRIRNTGQIDNMFYAQNRDFYIFEKIPIESSVVAWDGSFTFEIKLLAERSEPEWS